MLVELHDDLTLPSGRSMHPLRLLYVRNACGPLWFYSKILWPMPMEDVP